MILLKRFSGILLILMGTAGVLACGVAIYKTGNAEKQLRHFAGQAFDSTEAAVVGIHERLHKIGISVADTRVGLKSVPSQTSALPAGGIQDKDLADFQALASDFGEDLEKIKDRLLYYEAKTIRWIHLGGILIPLLLIWLGAGQAALIILGGRLCMRSQ